MKKKNISIRNSIIIVFVVLTFVTAGIISFIVYNTWISSAEEMSNRMAKDLNDEILHELEMFIHVPEHINQVNQKHIETGLVDLDNEIEREKFFVSVLKNHDNDIYSFSYGTENGEYYGARRNEDGDIEIMKNNTETNGNSWYYSVKDDLTSDELVVKVGEFDPRTREWYKAAKINKNPIFSPVYTHFIMKDLTLSAAYPIYDKEGMLKGVLGTHILLGSINYNLNNYIKDKNGFVVIIEKDSGEMIANSFGEDNFVILEDNTFKRTKVKDLENKIFTRAYEGYEETGEKIYKIGYNNDKYFINLTNYNKEGLAWVVISAIPESLLMSSIMDSMKWTFILIIIAVIISIIIYYLVANKLIKPINNLIEVTEKLSSGDLNNRVPIARDDEIGMISKSFNKMADTIYNLINNLEETVQERTSKLEESEAKLFLILDSTAEGIIGFDKEGNCTFCNQSCIKMLLYNNQDDLLGKNVHFQIHHSYKDGIPMQILECGIYKAFKEGKRAHSENEVFWRADGTYIDVEYASYPQYKDGELVGGVISFRDITMRKKDEEKIKYLSCHDTLTGLFNRSCFEDELIKVDEKEKLPISIIFGDINGLKLTNDVFGHAAGDELIRTCSDILKKACRDDDVIARVGGDEFIIILPKTKSSDAEAVIKRVKSELAKTKIAAIKCSMALGYDTKSSLEQKIGRVMEDAENKMYKDKIANRNTVNSEMISAIIGTLHEKNEKERLHSIIVSELCESIGNALKLPDAEVKKLKEAGYLHDIGKVTLNEDILNKETDLTEDEYKEMQQHSVIGFRILNLFDDTLNFAEGVYSHHEYWDGSGYPQGLKGEEIPRLARIIAVAEAYDFLVNRKALSKNEALQKIKSMSGIKYDPSIVDLFIAVMSNNETSL